MRAPVPSWAARAWAVIPFNSGAVLAVASEGSLALVAEAVRGLGVPVLLTGPVLLPGADLGRIQ